MIDPIGKTPQIINSKIQPPKNEAKQTLINKLARLWMVVWKFEHGSSSHGPGKEDVYTITMAAKAIVAAFPELKQYVDSMPKPPTTDGDKELKKIYDDLNNPIFHGKSLDELAKAATGTPPDMSAIIILNENISSLANLGSDVNTYLDNYTSTEDVPPSVKNLWSDLMLILKSDPGSLQPDQLKFLSNIIVQLHDALEAAKQPLKDPLMQTLLDAITTSPDGDSHDSIYALSKQIQDLVKAKKSIPKEDLENLKEFLTKSPNGDFATLLYMIQDVDSSLLDSATRSSLKRMPKGNRV